MVAINMSYKQWRNKLGAAVPLNLLPEVMRRPRTEVAALIRRKEIQVHTFKFPDGRVVRLVRLFDIMKFGHNPLTIDGMARALETIVSQPKRQAA